MQRKHGIRYRLCPYCNRMYDASKNHMCKQKRFYKNKRHEEYVKRKKSVTAPLTRKRWRYLRKAIIVADGGYCQRCWYKYHIKNFQDLTVHHIKPRIKRPDLMYYKPNLITLCRTCNDQLAEKQWRHSNTDFFNGYYGLDFKWSPNKRKFKNIHYTFAL